MKKLVALLEPYRTSIEYHLEHFNEERCSWRDFRNNLWLTIPDGVDCQVSLLLQEAQAEAESLKGG